MRFPTVRTAAWKHGLLLVWMLQAFAAQAPQGSVRGTVLAADNTGRPVAGATVEVQRLDGSAPQTYRAVTSNDGTFVVPNIGPGEYRLVARRAGFLTAEYGQRRWNRPGTTFSLAPGQSVEGLQVRMAPGGVIDGQLSDRQGNPAGATQVLALVPAYQKGRRGLKVYQSTISDDRGYYRLFNLPPGTYYVSALPYRRSAPIMTAVVNGNAGPLPEIVNRGMIERAGTAQLPLYFPGVLDARRATPIELAMGATFGRASFIVAPTPTRHIRGTVARGVSAALLLSPLNPVPGSSPMKTTANSETGAFEFQGVAPGAYMLVAIGEDTREQQILEMGESDLNNINVALGGGFTIPGRLRIEGRTIAENDPDFNYIYFNFDADPPLSGIEALTYSPLNNGTFTLRNLIPGSYRFSNLSIREGSAPHLRDAYIKSIRVAGQDVLNRGLHVTGPMDGTLEIVVGTSPGAVSGVVVNEARQPVGNATVVLALDTTSRSAFDLYRTATTDAAGRFSLRPVPPANFKIFAWEDVDDSAWQDPEFMKRFEDRGLPIVVRENANESVQVAVIR